MPMALTGIVTVIAGIVVANIIEEMASSTIQGKALVGPSVSPTLHTLGLAITILNIGIILTSPYWGPRP